MMEHSVIIFWMYQRSRARYQDGKNLEALFFICFPLWMMNVW